MIRMKSAKAPGKTRSSLAMTQTLPNTTSPAMLGVGGGYLHRDAYCIPHRGYSKQHNNKSRRGNYPEEEEQITLVLKSYAQYFIGIKKNVFNECNIVETGSAAQPYIQPQLPLRTRLG